MSRLTQLCALSIPLLVLLHLYVAPYTKVEESFNIQAIHDFIQYGVPVTNAANKFKALFDHITYSGSVPRTFVGSLFIAGLSKPLTLLQGMDGLNLQTGVRTILGMCNATALVLLVRAVRKAYGTRTALWYTAFQASQFHIFFYASRTLPNMFAFCLCIFATCSFLRDLSVPTGHHLKQLRRGFFLLSLAAVVFRSELALLIAAQSGWLMLKFGTVSGLYAITLLRSVIFPAVLMGGIAGVLISAPIDTYIWQSDRLFLPELEAFWFNIFPEAHQGASAWGTSPWHWYFTSAIPRLTFIPSLLLIPYGMVFSTRSLAILDNLIPATVYTAIYSILPHKETRFLFPIIPLLTLSAAISASSLSLRREKLAKLLVILLAVSTAISTFISHGIILPLSAQSYPGGHAFTALHEYHDTTRSAPHPNITGRSLSSPYVHLSNLALQTGVTRFTEQPTSNSNHTIPTTWRYEKTEKTNSSDIAFWAQFDYVVVEPSQLKASVLDTSAWQKVASVPALRLARPRISRASEARGCLVLACSKIVDPQARDGLYQLMRAMYGADVAWVYAVVHDVLREGYGSGVSLTGGRWLDWGLEERLVVLRQVDGNVV